MKKLKLLWIFISFNLFDLFEDTRMFVCLDKIYFILLISRILKNDLSRKMDYIFEYLYFEKVETFRIFNSSNLFDIFEFIKYDIFEDIRVLVCPDEIYFILLTSRIFKNEQS